MLEALFLLILIRLVVVLFPFKVLEKLIKFNQKDNNPDLKNDQEVHRVIRSIQRLSEWLPFECTCLVKAASAKIMLNRRNHSTTLYLGVTKDGNKLNPHAWLSSDSTILLGGEEVDKYAIVSSFT